MYPFKILNKKKYALCFLNAFLENLCLYLMPVILSIYLTIPFTLDKFKMLIILTITLKALEKPTSSKSVIPYPNALLW